MTNYVRTGQVGQHVRLHVVMELLQELEHAQLIVIARSMRLINATMAHVVQINVLSGHHGRLVRQHVAPQPNHDCEVALVAIQIVKLAIQLIVIYQHVRKIVINYVPVGHIGQTVLLHVGEELYQGNEHVQLIVTAT